MTLRASTPPATGAFYAHLIFAIKYAKNMRPGQKTKWIQTCLLESAYNATANETTGFTLYLLLLEKGEILKCQSFMKTCRVTG